MAGSNVELSPCSRRSSSAPALTLHRIRGNDRLLTDERPIDGARAPPLLPCAADEFRFLDASVSDRRSRSLFCKGAARSNPSNRGDPFLASLRALMGEGGMDKSGPLPQKYTPPRRRGDSSKDHRSKSSFGKLSYPSSGGLLPGTWYTVGAVLA